MTVVKGGIASVKIVRIGKPDSFIGKDGEEVAKRTMFVTFSGPIKVTAYGANVDAITELDLKKGDNVAYMLKKVPSITLQ